MQYFKILAIVILAASITSLAEDKGSIGFTLAYSLDGPFSTKVTAIKVTAVAPDSAAELAGIVTGHKILSIDDCKIPGCPKSKVIQLLTRKPGDIITLLINDDTGKQVLVNMRVK